MKYIIISLFATLIFAMPSTQAQETADNKYETITFKVEGVCGMCETRIENTTYDLKGVKSAKWELETNVLTAVINPKKVKREDIALALAEAGYASELAKANPEAYLKLPKCCRYADGVKKHGGGNR